MLGDNPLPTAHPKIMRTHEEFLPWAELQQELEHLNLSLDAGESKLIRGMLKILVPGYQLNNNRVD